MTAQYTDATLTGGHDGGQAYAFDGVDDYITINLDINPDTLPLLTMGAWVQSTALITDLYTRQQVISHDNGGYDRTLGIDYRGDGGGSPPGWSAFSGK